MKISSSWATLPRNSRNGYGYGSKPSTGRAPSTIQITVTAEQTYTVHIDPILGRDPGGQPVVEPGLLVGVRRILAPPCVRPGMTDLGVQAHGRHPPGGQPTLLGGWRFLRTVPRRSAAAPSRRPALSGQVRVLLPGRDEAPAAYGPAGRGPLPPSWP